MIGTRDLKEQARIYEDKLKKIKVLLFDVDGVLTNGLVYYTKEVGFNRFFHVHDGYGMRILQRAGVKVGIISGGSSIGLTQRADYLKLDYFFDGNEDKRAAFLKVKEDGYEDSEILFMGDEFFDIPLLKKAGFSAAPPDASFEITDHADYVTEKEAGKGCVREVIDMLRFAQNIYPEYPEFN